MILTSHEQLSARVLIRLDIRRLLSSLRNPSAGPILALVLPVGLLGGILWVVGRSSRPGVPDAEAALLLGLLLSGPVAFIAYTTIFRASDEALLRRLGFPASALFHERVSRFLLVSLAIALLALIPFAAAGESLGRPAAVALAAALGAWGGGAASAAWSARAVALPNRTGGGLLALGIRDREMRGVAPLLYAPLFPFLLGALSAAFVGTSGGVGLWQIMLVASIALGLVRLGQSWHSEALPRFAPQALEMSFEPPPSGVGEMSVGRGAGRLLPARVAAVWVRDSLMVNRRFAWAPRLVWPVAFLAFFGLARWGYDPSTRGWVAAAAMVALLAQSVAAIALGRLERSGTRWIDRSLGLTWRHRLAGRWAWGFGASLWLTIPLGLSWHWWSGVGGASGWIAAGAGTAMAGAVASLAASGWR
ncbi:hypothetical protein BH23GEM6_BH23GEM6_17430 [soil metagenome]